MALTFERLFAWLPKCVGLFCKRDIPKEGSFVTTIGLPHKEGSFVTTTGLPYIYKTTRALTCGILCQERDGVRGSHEPRSDLLPQFASAGALFYSRGESRIHPKKSCIYLQKSPLYTQHSPTSLQNSQICPRKRPMYPQKSLICPQKSPTSLQNSRACPLKRSNVLL